MKTNFIDNVGAFTPGGRFVIDGAKDGTLNGLTFAAKDLFDVAGKPTGAGNPTWLATHEIPEASSPIIDTLLDAGARLVGKVLTDELAFSLLGDNVHYGAPINANACERVTGGSSSGSVAAVAAKLVDFALGTDTGGSTRVPASYCGVWGLRTTHGLLPAAGLVPLHPIYDTATWLAHDAGVFVRVGAALMPQSDYAPTRVLRLDDASAFADDVFSEPMARVLVALEGRLGSAAQGVNAAQGEALEDWRTAYALSGAHHRRGGGQRPGQGGGHPRESARLDRARRRGGSAVRRQFCAIAISRSCRGGRDPYAHHGDDMHSGHRRTAAGQHAVQRAGRNAHRHIADGPSGERSCADKVERGDSARGCRKSGL